LQRLGPCGLYAIAGIPGPGIATWLDSTRARAALSYREIEPTTVPDRRRLFGNQMLALLAPLSCAAGRDASCELALLTPFADRRRLPSVTSTGGQQLVSTYYFELEDYPGDVVAALRASLGEARFARWWASDLPPA